MVSAEKRTLSPEAYVQALEFDIEYFDAAYDAAKMNGFPVPVDKDAAVQASVDRASAGVEVVIGGDA